MADDPQVLLDDWRQGDIFLAPIEIPLMSREEGRPVVIYADARGAVMLSQSCDIVRSHEEKPFVQVAMLVPATADELVSIKAGQRPRYGYIQAAADHGFAIDFDIAATIDKEVIHTWVRTPGCADDVERRQFAAALARHRQRFAFPDAFNDLVKPVRRWLEGKRSAQSAFGRFVRAITEIRVICDDWDKPSLLTFSVFVTNHPPAVDEPEWQKAIATLEGKSKLDGFPDPSFRVVTYDEVSAQEYISSDRLDLDGLSDA